MIAADGAWSVVRKAMLESVQNFNYAQSFQEYGYKELHIPAGANGSFQMEKHALHIWPRKSHMMIALPNTDGSFTMTLFYPYTGFDALKTPADVLAFFKKDFPDAVPLMPTLAEDFFGNPTGALVTVKCSPWNNGNTVLMGDAAHAIVPFFAQGMNSGFEDCAVLNSLVTARSLTGHQVFEAFSRLRKDSNAGCDCGYGGGKFLRNARRRHQPEIRVKKAGRFRARKTLAAKSSSLRYSMVHLPPRNPLRRGAASRRYSG